MLAGVALAAAASAAVEDTAEEDTYERTDYSRSFRTVRLAWAGCCNSRNGPDDGVSSSWSSIFDVPVRRPLDLPPIERHLLVHRSHCHRQPRRSWIAVDLVRRCPLALNGWPVSAIDCDLALVYLRMHHDVPCPSRDLAQQLLRRAKHFGGDDDVYLRTQ